MDYMKTVDTADEVIDRSFDSEDEQEHDIYQCKF